MLILINWFVWKSAVLRMTPKDEGTEAALTLLATRKPLLYAPARTVLAGTGVARHAGYCLLVFRHTETKDPQAQPDMPEMQPGNPPGDSFARVDTGYETAD